LMMSSLITSGSCVGGWLCGYQVIDAKEDMGDCQPGGMLLIIPLQGLGTDRASS
jgi:hypothetical protein